MPTKLHFQQSPILPTPRPAPRYQVWVAGTFHQKGKRPVMVGDEKDSLREYGRRQRMPCEVRTAKTRELMWPRKEERE